MNLSRSEILEHGEVADDIPESLPSGEQPGKQSHGIHFILRLMFLQPGGTMGIVHCAQVRIGQDVVCARDGLELRGGGGRARVLVRVVFDCCPVSAFGQQKGGGGETDQLCGSLCGGSGEGSRREWAGWGTDFFSSSSVAVGLTPRRSSNGSVGVWECGREGGMRGD